MKSLTREQLESRKAQAARFLRDVVGDSERADEIEDESLEDYAARRRIRISNPERRPTVARKTVDDYRQEVQDLKEQIRDLEDENEGLQERLDGIADIIAPEDEDDDQD